MNDKTRRRVVTIAAVIGSSAAAMSVVFFGGIKNIVLMIFLSFLAGTLGHFLFTGLGILLMRMEKHLTRGRPGDPVYSLGKLPAEEAESAGGKGRALAELYQAGHPVPDGCILLPGAFDGDEVTAEAWEKVREQVARLRAGKSIAFAVRSSATNEDSSQASFAGEFESILHVHSDEEIHEAVRAVRKSRLSARVQSYSQAQGLDSGEPPMAVIIQKLIQADFSGVLFTVDPLSGNLSQMTGNFVPGMGDKLVSGQVSASTFTFERPAGIYNGPVELRRLAKRLHQAAHAIENEFGSPQDIEWAIVSGKLFILQARPITTLNGYNPVTAEWNDTLKGNFLWSATNLMEACPDVLTPFTASLRSYLEQRGGPSLSVKNYPLNGTIGGRFYVNITVQVSAFAPMFKGDAHRAYRELAGWWGELPEEMEIPLLPLTKQEWQREVLPDLWRTNRQFGRYRKQTIEFVKQNQQHCSELQAKIGKETAKAGLAVLWKNEIFPLYRDSIFYIVANSSDVQMRLERELRELVGAEDANALLSNLGGLSRQLESLGPMAGLGKVMRGEMSPQVYLDAYGHRGENECECAWARPVEDPDWLDRQLAQWSRNPVDVESLLARQRAAYEAAWERFRQQHPRKVKSIQKRLLQAAEAAQRREIVRSESTRVISVVRAFALQAGELLGVGQDVFFLTIDEVLDGLTGSQIAFQLIPIRRETHDRYRALPPYPTLICGRFDPFAWAADPQRRSDIYDSRVQATSPTVTDINAIKGTAGALGIVEGTVRRLDSLDDAEQFQAGEVLVTTMTNIGWTPLFPHAAAIVTDLGAPLSHAAIVARELGIPAVVGCGNATMRLKTGDRVRVNGGLGLVEII